MGVRVIAGIEESIDGKTGEYKIYKREMRKLYTSNYIGMTGYLMDFGFGGFIGYGKVCTFVRLKKS